MANQTSNHAPYRADLTPEERGRALVAALRALPAEGPTTLPGNGDFLWCYQYTLVAPDDITEAHAEKIGTPEGYCGSIGCAVELGRCLGLLRYGRTLENELELGGVRDIFYNNSTYGVDWDAVTPAMVADELERVLDRRWS